jgi:hypothetical protein
MASCGEMDRARADFLGLQSRAQKQLFPMKKHVAIIFCFAGRVSLSLLLKVGTVGDSSHGRVAIKL